MVAETVRAGMGWAGEVKVRAGVARARAGRAVVGMEMARSMEAAAVKGTVVAAARAVARAVARHVWC